MPNHSTHPAKLSCLFFTQLPLVLKLCVHVKVVRCWVYTYIVAPLINRAMRGSWRSGGGSRVQVVQSTLCWVEGDYVIPTRAWNWQSWHACGSHIHEVSRHYSVYFFFCLFCIYFNFQIIEIKQKILCRNSERLSYFDCMNRILDLDEIALAIIKQKQFRMIIQRMKNERAELKFV